MRYVCLCAAFLIFHITRNKKNINTGNLIQTNYVNYLHLQTLQNQVIIVENLNSRLSQDVETPK